MSSPDEFYRLDKYANEACRKCKFGNPLCGETFQCNDCIEDDSWEEEKAMTNEAGRAERCPAGGMISPKGPHQRMWEYDGAFKCLDCQAQWGELPGNPAMPETCAPPAASTGTPAEDAWITQKAAEEDGALVLAGSPPAPSEPGSAEQLSGWSSLSAEQQLAAINAVREFTKQKPFWAGQGRDLVGPEALAAAYAASLRAQLQEQEREIKRLTKIVSQTKGENK